MPRGRDLHLSVLVAALCAAGCSAGSGGHAGLPGQDPLDANWLDNQGVITPDHLARVFAVGANDADARSLFSDAQARLGGGQLSELARRFGTCPASMMAEGGLTLIQSFDVWVPRAIEDLAFHEVPPANAKMLADLQRGPARELRVVEKPDFMVVQRTTLPQICIVARLSVAEAYEAVVHELVHALRYSPRDRWVLARTTVDPDAFRRSLVLGPGGEAEAYSRSAGARIRLRHGRLLASPLLVAFDPATGAPRIPAGDLAQLILSPQPGGLGYADGLLREALPSARREIVNELTARRQLVETMITDRRGAAEVCDKNIGVHTHNIDAHRNNLAAAKARGDRALAQRSSAGLAEAEAGLVRTRALLEATRASEIRLVAELASVNGELEALQQLAAPQPVSAGTER